MATAAGPLRQLSAMLQSSCYVTIQMASENNMVIIIRVVRTWELPLSLKYKVKRNQQIRPTQSLLV